MELLAKSYFPQLQFVSCSSCNNFLSLVNTLLNTLCTHFLLRKVSAYVGHINYRLSLFYVTCCLYSTDFSKRILHYFTEMGRS